ncbi:MAG: Rdx family protein [Deltaproteobacteria bacterium]|nr:Rdx family protein [Deltaproteobacteria bacterium]
MAATIKDETGVEPELVSGGGGIFDVVVDGDMIFSKHEVDRFPEPDEILSKLRDL